MSIELIKDILRIEELRGKEDTQALVETEIYLNPSRPDLESILWTDGVVEILSTKVIRDRLVVSGVVKFKVVYKSGEEEKRIHTVDSNADFREEIEIEGITEDMSATIKTNIEYIEHELLDERKVSLKALVSLEGKVEEVNNIEIIKDIEEKENLQTLKETIKYKEIQGRETAYAFVKEAFELMEDKPAIEEILKLSIQAYEEEATVAEDRIIISGMVNARVVYYGEGQIATIEEEMPFNHFLEIPGALSDSKGEILIEVVEGGYEVLENDEGELKVLDLEAKIRVSGLAYSENEKKLIVDAYSTREKINIEKEEVNLVENIKNIIHKENIVKDLSSYRIREIYDLTAYPSVIDSRFVDEEFIIEGILMVQGIYLDDTTEDINTLREEVPYKYYLSLEEKNPDLVSEVSLDLETIRANISKDMFVIEASVKHNIKINRMRSLSLIKSLEETGEIIDKKNRPSITIYIVQRNDKLWNIAKRYNTTIEEILQANDNINPNNIMAGEKIIIEKTVDISF
ncbi:DUF3794 and LysM peptidoglycan-binding domain-containing protein [Tissierella pigra]|uniref:DUF3794 domain-containing protein n=1 Tax=Tissierella pigra TaxID=2607614 RepID=A0A6N7XVM7_9FIRM|nr:SPOCS domain-containing protein [Tissierella pigra]MSU00594.1 DUF3794 domain-containing protein [Tissierella pigra]